MLFLSRSLVYLVAVDHLAEANMNYAGKFYSHKLPSRIKEPIATVKPATRLKSGLGAGHLSPDEPRQLLRIKFFFTAV